MTVGVAFSSRGFKPFSHCAAIAVEMRYAADSRPVLFASTPAPLFAPCARHDNTLAQLLLIQPTAAAAAAAAGRLNRDECNFRSVGRHQRAHVRSQCSAVPARSHRQHSAADGAGELSKPYAGRIISPNEHALTPVAAVHR